MPESEGTVLASRTTETYGDRWVDVFWENEVTLTVGQEYFIRIEGDDELSCLRAASNIYEGGQAYAGFQPYSNYDYTFRTYYCYDVACEQILMSGGFPNSFLTSKDQPQTVATDITVPLGNDFHLNRLTVYFWVQAGSNIQHADITFYEDDFGVPGSVMETLEGVVPTSQTFVIPRYGYDVLTVVFDIPTQVLPGKFDNVTTYWVSFDVQAGLGSAMINARSDARIGYFSALTFDAGDSWEINEGWDISATFEGECLPVSGDACENPELIADQTSDLNCLALSSTGVAQSFTASTHELAGAAVKFFAPSVGYDVTLSVWDELPTQGGSKLGSKTVQTTGQAWVEVMWDFVVSVEPDQTYYLVVEGGSGLPCVA
ncbi:MAG TPA: hypothetical protein VKY29_07645, partial [Cryomorphaceae bacterium]|nr:hypothetical protein [Cryomorphaceae bacterium]